MKINYSRTALKFLRKANKKTSEMIVSDIETLAKNPDAMKNRTKKLEAREGYRLVAKKYRVLYDFEDEALTIYKIGHRKDVYR
ncbi:MAG: plasmid stabilization protein [Kordiimonas sp.]|nr:plasmid stabilization protein [Kordiimonas sp.]|tara:strand:+ start:834 stop:1082 length:249 start_codon:yes stop_codon:yes gene_type:complete